MESQRKSYNLKNLYLDPNNYRFVDNSQYLPVDETDVTKEPIQRRCRRFLEGNKRENIRDLINSFKSNGFLDVDVIQVKEIESNQYLVLEGNRRVTALKAMQDDYADGIDIGNLDPSIFRSVPFKIHLDESDEKHRIIMGLKHISGNKKWPAINQAQLIYDFLQPYWGNASLYYQKEQDLQKSLGISKIRLRQTQRAYHLILDFKESDFSDQFQSDMYSLFVEIIKRPAIREWLDWDDQEYKPKNSINKERLYSWLCEAEYYPDEIEPDDDVESDDNVELVTREPIISKALEIRNLSLFIQDENALQVMEEESDVTKGLMKSGYVQQQDLINNLKDIKDSINNIKVNKKQMENSDFRELEELRDLMTELLPKQQFLRFSEVSKFNNAFSHGPINHFSELTIHSYKAFSDFSMRRLNRINIIAGMNNSGKTSLLESIYLLTSQNDFSSFLKMTSLKNKIEFITPQWLNRIIEKEIVIHGIFNNVETSFQLNKYDDFDIDKSDDYICSYEIKSSIDGSHYESKIHTYVNRPFNRIYKTIQHLCISLFKSPYFYDFDELLLTLNSCQESKVNDISAIEHVISFIKEVDPEIRDIRLSESDGIKRFVVDSNKNKDRNLDITHYGEGIQRIFELAIAFAHARNGVICIDEFETAIHKTLLIPFTKFVQQLAKYFNVQVFITSHSKECIDAFVQNDYRNEDISAYYLENVDSKVMSKFITGEKLKKQIEYIDFDLRGVFHG